MSLLRRLSTSLGRWPVALVVVLLLAGVVLLPGLGESGLWEPHERSLADRAAPPAAVATVQVTPAAPAAADACVRAAPPAAVARSLQARAIKLGRDTFGDADRGRRLPFALMGLLTVLATAGVARRLAGGRAGVLTCLVLLSMPLLVLQARMLTSEIGTACGGALIVYALVALAHPAARTRGLALAGLDLVVSIAALTLGLVLGFAGGGALLGLVVPLGAFAAVGLGSLREVGPDAPRRRLLVITVTGLAGLAAFGLLALLAHQLYRLTPPVPGMMPPAREVAGHAIVTEGCWSWALGGLWRPDEDLRMVFDSTFEQIGYGTFPWGVLAPIAVAGLLRAAEAPRRIAGAIALAWGAGAWIASEVFQRKVGFTLYAGFPALALAVGVYLDGLLARRARGTDEDLPGGLRLIGLFVLLAVINLGKDMHSFADRVTSLLIGTEQLPYPKAATLLGLPTKAWILVIGGLIALGFALATALPAARPGARPWLRQLGLTALVSSLALTVGMGAFWAFVWQPRIAAHVSTKALFDTYRSLRAAGDALVLMGDLGQAPRAYAPDATPELVATRDLVVKALQRPGRVFAIAPQTELCTLHREIGGKPYYVIDDRNVRHLLLSNSKAGTTDKNPLATAIVHEEPQAIAHRPAAPVIFDRKIQLLGWDIPARMKRGARYQVTMYYKILQPVGGAWKSLMHFDGGLRFNGDHDPIAGRCPTSSWQPGDYIIDRHTLRAGGGTHPGGPYDVWIGFFTGSAPNWKNMPVSEAPPPQRDTADRVKITSVVVE